MKNLLRFKPAYLSALFLGLLFVAYIVPVLGVTSTPFNEFNATPDSISLNWSNSYMRNITIFANNSNAYNITVLVRNSPTLVTSNYSQQTRYADDSRYNATCFSGSYLSLLVSNRTGSYTNTTNNLTNVSSENFTLALNATCPPGKYYGFVTLNSSNATNANDSLNITATINVPITDQNELNATTGIAHFRGVFNSSGYHSYYLNASNLSNARSISLVLAWNNSSVDLDVFLLNGSYLAKSIGSNTSSETINYTYPSSANLLEIRVAGNTTTAVSYNGTIYFSTLNLTNSTNNYTFPSYQFSELNVTDNRLLNLTIRNDGSLAHTTVQEMKEIYHVHTFNTSSTTNFSVLIPSYATRIRAFVAWTGGSNATLNLFMPNGTLAGTSNGKKANANISNYIQEEYVDTTQIPNASGIWKVGIVNNSGSDNYNITIRFWVNASSWITTNYSTFNFNATGSVNSSQDFYLNFTVPTTAMAGNYSGYAIYKDANGSVQQMRLDTNVTSAVLVVNNTLQSDTLVVKDIIGFNRTGSNEVNLTINNTGNTDIVFGNSTNSTNLSYSSYKILFSFSYPDRINASQSGVLRVNFTVNTDNTSNQAGIYRGWIYLNATEAYPYQGFNLSMHFNLTNYVDANVTSIISGDGNNVMENITRSENMTVYVNLSYPNGTLITDLQLGNFSLWLSERNVSSYRYPTSSSLTKYNLSGISDSNASVYITANARNEINVTVPANLPGGFYMVNVEALANRSGVILTGNTSSSVLLMVNNTGLNLSIVSDGVTGTATSTDIRYLNVSVRNYGPVIAGGNITLIATCGSSGASVGMDSSPVACLPDGFSVSTSSGLFRINVSENGTEFCWYRWRVTPAANKSDTCTFTVNATDSNFGNITGISLTVNTTSSGSGSSGSGGGGSGTTECSVDANCAWNYYCQATVCKALSCASDEEIVNHRCAKKADAVNVTIYPNIVEIMPGETNSTEVTVKNVGSKGSFSAKLAATVDSDINTTSITPSYCSLGINATCVFNVTFNASKTASIGNHTGTFKAYKSDDEGVSNSKTFVVKVAATAERVEFLKALYQTVSDNFTKYVQLFKQINTSGLNLSDGNMSSVSNLIKDINTTLMVINAYIYNNSYDLADPMLLALKSTMNSLEEKTAILKAEYNAKLGESGGTILIWAAVAIAVAAVVGFVIYLFLPPQGYHPARGFKPKSDMRRKVDGMVSRAKKTKTKFKRKR